VQLPHQLQQPRRQPHLGHAYSDSTGNTYAYGYTHVHAYSNTNRYTHFDAETFTDVEAASYPGTAPVALTCVEHDWAIEVNRSYLSARLRACGERSRAGQSPLP
jgi:hypothetical protein